MSRSIAVQRERSSVGRASASQAEGRGFDPRRSLLSEAGNALDAALPVPDQEVCIANPHRRPDSATASSFAQMREAWKAAEELGVDSIYTWDHFYPLYGDP
jgi:hypothetical protein